MQFLLEKLNKMPWRAAICVLLTTLSLAAQSTNVATFGDTLQLGETPADLVVDELRGLVYLSRQAAGRVEVYDYVNKKLLNPISVGQGPTGLAMSMDSSLLYVANTTSATISVIQLGSNQLITTVSLPAKPEGVAVGADGRLLITTQGIGVNNANSTLLIYDGRQDAALQLTAVPSPPPITTANPSQAVFVGRPTTPYPGRLLRTPDGNYIVGMVAINQTTNNATTTMFVYEVASGTILRYRTVTGQSTVLAMAPDASRFMAGGTQYDFTSIGVNGAFNVGNLPFTLPTPNANQFPAGVNTGGAAFSADGNTLYAAFNYTSTVTTQRPTANILLVSNPRNLGVRLGIRLKESVLGKMVSTADGSTIFAISESGLMTLPIGDLYTYPILDPESTQVFLANDPCNKGIARASLKISNLGAGKLTYSVPNLGSALIWEVTSGLAPSTLTFTMDPGRVNVNRQPGTNLYTNNNGQAVTVNLSSAESINIPNTIRVYMNLRNSDQRGMIYPVPNFNNLNGARGLRDLVLDEKRNRVYISNSGLNRIEVFDTAKLKFLAPIEAGQFPQAMAMSLDGASLYVANNGGESIMIFDLDSLTLLGSVNFPPLPRNGQIAPAGVEAMAMTLSGLQFVQANGIVWRTLGNDAVARLGNGVLPNAVAGTRFMAATPGGEAAILVAGNPANGYYYDALVDAYTATRNIYSQNYVSFVAPAAAAAQSQYFLVGGLILSSSLTPIGGVERPGAVQNQTNPANPNGPPIQVSVSAGQRNVFSVLPLDSNRILRVTTPVRTTGTAATRDEARTTLELLDIRTQSESTVAILPENPAYFVSGSTQAINVPSRQMAIDSKGNVYVLTLSGLTIVPTTPTNSSTQPVLPNGARSIVNATDGTTNYKPGAFITLTGRNLATAQAADTIPLPTVLGGSCVTFNDVPLPIISASPTQIVAQIPDTVRPGLSIVQVRSLLNAQQSDPFTVTVQK